MTSLRLHQFRCIEEECDLKKNPDSCFTCAVTCILKKGINIIEYCSKNGITWPENHWLNHKSNLAPLWTITERICCFLISQRQRENIWFNCQDYWCNIDVGPTQEDNLCWQSGREGQKLFGGSCGRQKHSKHVHHSKWKVKSNYTDQRKEGWQFWVLLPLTFFIQLDMKIPFMQSWSPWVLHLNFVSFF